MGLTRKEYRVLLRIDFAAFIERCFRYLYPQAKFLPNWHIEVMAAKLEATRLGKIRRLIINVPPRHLKSLCASVAFPAWILGQDPTAQILCVSYAQDLADKLARDCLRIMESDFYRKLFPHTRLSRKRPAVAEFTTTKNGFRKAISIEGGLTGRGADYIIIDDPLKPDGALSDVQRKNVNEWYGNTLFSRQNDKATGRIIVVMQRLHEDDLVGHVLDLEQWEHIRLSAIAETDEEHVIQTPYGERRFTRRAGELLHAAREGLDVLERTRRTMGSYVFAAQYLQAPAPLEGGIVKREWFKLCPAEEFPATFDCIVQSWDTANKASELANYSVCTAWGLKDKHIYLLDVFRMRLDFPDLVRAVIEQRQKHNATTILIEDAASGTQLVQQLREKGVYEVSAVKPSGDKVMRLHAHSTQIENGLVHLPKDASWLDAYLQEITTFPNSKHSDQVDSTSQALAWIGEANREPAILQYYREECERMYGKEYVAQKQREMDRREGL